MKSLLSKEELKRQMESLSESEKKPLIRTKKKFEKHNPFNLEGENFFFYIVDLDKEWADAFLKHLLIKAILDADIIKRKIPNISKSKIKTGLDAWM
jgi:hypothetical protein